MQNAEVAFSRRLRLSLKQHANEANGIPAFMSLLRNLSSRYRLEHGVRVVVD